MVIRQNTELTFTKPKELWEDPDLIEIPVRTSDGPRFLVVGKISEKHWSGVTTYRGDKIRIISVRRARKEEVDLYEGQGI